MKSFAKTTSLTKLVTLFLGEMHRFDAGRTLPLLHAAKLTTPQLAALEFVFERRTISAVASYLGLSRPATSQMIHKLVRRGLVRRFEGATDRREKAVVLTPKGRGSSGKDCRGSLKAICRVNLGSAQADREPFEGRAARDIATH